MKGLQGARDSYTLGELIGTGGMSVVHKGVDSHGRVVAIKIFRPPVPSESPEYKTFLSRFEREAQILLELEHPNIVKGIDYGTDQ